MSVLIENLKKNEKNLPHIHSIFFNFYFFLFFTRAHTHIHTRVVSRVKNLLVFSLGVAFKNKFILLFGFYKNASTKMKIVLTKH